MKQDTTMEEIFRSLGRLEGKIDGVLDHLKRLNGSVENHAKKIDVLEDCVATVKGKASLLGAIGGTIFGAAVATIARIFFK